VVSVLADLLYQPPLLALLEMAQATSRVRLEAACLNPVGFQNSAARVDLGFCAARLYSLRRPPRTGLRLIGFWERSAAEKSGRGVELAAAMASPSVVVRLALG